MEQTWCGEVEHGCLQRSQLGGRILKDMECNRPGLKLSTDDCLTLLQAPSAIFPFFIEAHLCHPTLALLAGRVTAQTALVKDNKGEALCSGPEDADLFGQQLAAQLELKEEVE